MGRYIVSTAAYMSEKNGDKRLIRIECYEANEPYCNGERIRCEWGVVVFHPVDERDKYKETIGTPIMITKKEWSNRPTDSYAFDQWVFDKCGWIQEIDQQEIRCSNCCKHPECSKTNEDYPSRYCGEFKDWSASDV